MTTIPPPALDALLALRGGGRLLLGRERIAILAALGDHGSITKAALSLGISYKTAADAIAAINNLLPRPAVITQTGGAQGGGAVLTDAGRRLIADFRRLEQRLAELSRQLLAPEGDEGDEPLLWGLGLKTSARNLFRAEVVAVNRSAVSVEVVLAIADGQEIVAVVTNASADDLRLAPGRAAMALVKSSGIILARNDGSRYSARNRLSGVVSQRSDDGINSEIGLDLGGGKSLTAVITSASADDLALTPGVPALALFKASEVILAVE